MNTKNTDTPLSSEIVEHVAKLAQITLTNDEIPEIAKDLTSILKHIDQIQRVDTSGVEPLDHPTELKNRTREDSEGQLLSREQALLNAPAVLDAYLDVPKVLGGKS
tara:strand:- start:13 stop:330 length:318 start_codon:yes stop_codon:yes gene_type:complete